MHRLSNGTQVNILPTPSSVTGTPGYATAGIVGQQAPSDIDPDAFNAQQEELCNIVESAGLTLDKTRNNQVLSALQILFGSAGGLSAEVERAEAAEDTLAQAIARCLSLDNGGTVNGDVVIGSGKWLHVDTIVAAAAALINFGSPVEFDNTVKVDGDLTLAGGKWLHVDTVVSGGASAINFGTSVEVDDDLQVDGVLRAGTIQGHAANPITTVSHLIAKASASINNNGTQFGGNQGDANNPIGGRTDGTYFDGHSMFAYASATPVYIGTGSNTSLINFYSGSTLVGSISTQGSSVAYNQTSDYRTKTDVNALDGVEAASRIQAMRPVSHRWKESTEGAVTHGFIAHELQEIAPYAVTGEKDAVDDNGDAIHQTVDLTRIIPDLVAALRHALGRIEALEAEKGVA